VKRPYLALAAVVVVVAAGLGLVGGRGRDEAPRTVPVAAPLTELAIAIEAVSVSPATVSVPKGHRVRLRVEHRGAATVRLALAGYEDALAIPPLEPGTTWTGEFLADRPGEDFAWLLDDRPAGRLMVTGSHLIEGHR
jgi:hypothetical protein